MSQYHVIEVIFHDQGILVQSLNEIGYDVEVYNEGVEVGRGFSRKKCHLVVRKNQFGGFGDVGFERTSEGYVMHADDYDAGRYGSRFKLKDLNKKYVENKLKRYVNTVSNCSIFSRTENEKGQVEIHLRVM